MFVVIVYSNFDPGVERVVGTFNSQEASATTRTSKTQSTTATSSTDQRRLPSFVPMHPKTATS